MAEAVLIDTDILIDTGRGLPDAVACLKQYEQLGILAISVITQMELMVGCRDKREFQSLEKFLRRFQIVNLDEKASETAVELIQQYRLSHGLLIPDALIAATALTFDLPLLSKNQRDYRFIRNLQLLPYP